MPLAIISISLVVTAIAMWFLAPSSLFGYVFGLAIGITMLLALLRKLGKKAQRSLVATELFYKITKHKATVYNIRRQPYNISVTIHGDGDDYEDLLDILKRQMRFPADRAKEAAKYVSKVAPDKPLEEKIREALQYLDSCNITTGA